MSRPVSTHTSSKLFVKELFDGTAYSTEMVTGGHSAAADKFSTVQLLARLIKPCINIILALEADASGQSAAVWRWLRLGQLQLTGD